MKRFIIDKIKSLITYFCFTLIRSFTKNNSTRTFGINAIGYINAEMGLGQAARNLLAALKEVGIPGVIFDLKVRLNNSERAVEHKFQTSNGCKYAINLIAIGPDIAYRVPFLMKFDDWANSYNVGYWFWELEKFPTQWKHTCNLMDEIWVNTDFVQNSLSQFHSCVYKVPMCIEFVEPRSKYTQSDFNLPSDCIVFLTSFDFNSSIARKNPQAVVSAFVSAFPVGDENCCLIIKTQNGEKNLVDYEAIQDLIRIDPRIRLFDEALNIEDTRALMKFADCYVSLHRSEGFGLGLAESMYLGKPVIGTAYSGNLDFMNSDNAFLVPYALVDVQPGEYLFGVGQIWAEADVGVAATMMRDVFHNPKVREAVGENAAAYMRANHSIAVVSEALKLRLSDISTRLS